MNKIASTHEQSLTDFSITELDAETLESIVGGGLSLGTYTQHGSSYFVSDSSTGEGDAVYL